MSLYSEKKVPTLSVKSLFFIGVTLSFMFIYGVDKFFDNYDLKFRSPIILQPPLSVMKRVEEKKAQIISPIPVDKPKTTPTPTLKAKKMTTKALLTIREDIDTVKLSLIQNSKYPDFINHIWIHESGQGTNGNAFALHSQCKAKGMTNEFGFYPRAGWCWDTFEEGVKRLELWREREAKGLTDNQALCYYNGAGKTNDCAYLTNDYLSMN